MKRAQKMEEELTVKLFAYFRCRHKYSYRVLAMCDLAALGTLRSRSRLAREDIRPPRAGPPQPFASEWVSVLIY